MGSRVYNAIYSKEDVMAKKLVFSAAMVSFNLSNDICVMNAPKKAPIELSAFSDEQLDEIYRYLNNYSEFPYVMEANGSIYVFVPTLYPTSVMSIVLRMDVSPSDFLRLARERADLFVLSPGITSQASRMTARLESKKNDFLDFCKWLENAFLRMERLNLTFCDEELQDGYCEELIFLSKFFAVPIEEIVVNDSKDGIPINSNFALFVAFSSCMMMLARNDALERSIRAELDFSAGALNITISFVTDEKTSDMKELFFWERLAFDRRMIFEHGTGNGRAHVSFRPYVIDLAYFGMKQNLVSFE